MLCFDSQQNDTKERQMNFSVKSMEHRIQKSTITHAFRPKHVLNFIETKEHVVNKWIGRKLYINGLCPLWDTYHCGDIVTFYQL